eukprot:gene7684-845_t
MEAEQNLWVMLECETHVWILLTAVRGFLQSAYAMLVALHSPIEKLLEQDPTASLARRLLQPYMDELGSRLQRPDCKELLKPDLNLNLKAYS